jgi:hypothetical protein
VHLSDDQDTVTRHPVSRVDSTIARRRGLETSAHAQKHELGSLHSPHVAAAAAKNRLKCGKNKAFSGFLDGI